MMALVVWGLLFLVQIPPRMPLHGHRWVEVLPLHGQDPAWLLELMMMVWGLFLVQIPPRMPLHGHRWVEVLPLHGHLLLEGLPLHVV